LGFYRKHHRQSPHDAILLCPSTDINIVKEYQKVSKPIIEVEGLRKDFGDFQAAKEK